MTSRNFDKNWAKFRILAKKNDADDCTLKPVIATKHERKSLKPDRTYTGLCYKYKTGFSPTYKNEIKSEKSLNYNLGSSLIPIKRSSDK